MKRNISINISGIIFHIEEDGYENLRKYLDTITRYFSSFEDSSEIMADIESRIAEIFLSKLNEGKQVITAEDVQALKTTMGSVSDFKAAEEQEFSGEGQFDQANTSGGSNATEEKNNLYENKRLQRDQKRKVLGGVCAGLGNYFNVDPVWIRLLFTLLVFAYGITLFVYLIMWIIVPGAYDLEEPEVTKKMFREPERKVVGGVCGGVAAYFGIDIVAVRVLFVIGAVFFFVGFLIYIVLWVVLPEAKTITDRMEMQGEPVTLSNIESNIKKNLNVEEEAEESAVTKILLFPFRLIGLILTGLSKLIVPIVDILRVAIGVVIILMGVSFLFATIVTGGVLIGIFSTSSWMGSPEFGIPVALMTQSFPGWLVIAGVVALLIPSVFITLVGSSIVAKKYVFNTSVGWTMFVLFFVSLTLLSVGVPKIIYAFKEEGEHRVENTYTMIGKTALLKIKETGLDGYKAASLTLKGYEGTSIKLVQKFEAQGNTRQQAIENAKMVTYQVVQEDSVFTFDSNIRFKENASFRAQRLNMTLYVPYDFPFVMTHEMSRFVTQYVDRDYLDGQTWKMTENGLVCVSCPEGDKDAEEWDTEREEVNLSDFDELKLSGIFDVRIRKGDNYAVELEGSTREKNKYSIYRDGNTLVVQYQDNRKFWRKNFLESNRLRINITMPSLTRLEAKGAGKITFREFQSDKLSIDLMGAVKTTGDIESDDVNVRLTGASELELRGNGKTLDASVQGASSLKAFQYKVTTALVEVNGASSAKVNVSGTLEMEEGVASKIEYRGNPKIIKNN